MILMDIKSVWSLDMTLVTVRDNKGNYNIKTISKSKYFITKKICIAINCFR